MRIKIVCKHCGSEDVCRDAWAQWDATTQQWVLGPVYDHAFCSTCEADATLEEVPLN